MKLPMNVGSFQYSKRKTVKEDGVTTHYYDRSVGETPENALLVMSTLWMLLAL